MKMRAKPKVHNRVFIGKRKDIGYLQLVSYLTGGATDHLEFKIKKEECRNQGIMSRELPKYLKYLNKWGHNQLIAVVKEDNIASKKLLERNGFTKVATIGENETYIIDMRFTPQIVENMVAKVLLS